MTVAGATFSTRTAALRDYRSAVATIMVKELRSRMRGRRAFVVLTLYLALLALITWGVYTIVAPEVRQQVGFGGGGSALVGQSIFTVVSIFQLILVAFIAPAFTSGQISLEREKQTLDLLISTPLRPGAIVIGKLLAALAFVVLMIVAAIPITAIVLMYGGASVDDILRQQAVLLTTALGLGAIGLFYSALLKRTQAATVLTYSTMLALTLGTLMLFIFWTLVSLQGSSGFGPTRRAPEPLLYLNPGIAMLDVVANTEPGGFGAIGRALGELRGTSPQFGGGEIVCERDVCFPADAFGRPIRDGSLSGPGGYWWPRFAISTVVVAVVLTLASMRLVIPAGMRFAFRRRRSPAAAAPPDGVIEEVPVAPGGREEPAP